MDEMKIGKTLRSLLACLSALPLAGAILLGDGPANAASIQSVRVDLDLFGPLGRIGQSTDFDETSAGDGEQLDDDVLAEVHETGAFSRGSLDRFGNLGFEGAIFSNALATTEARSADDAFVSPAVSLSRVTSRVIVDGGRFELLGADNSFMTLILKVTSSLLPLNEAEGARLAAKSILSFDMVENFGAAEVRNNGIPLNFTQSVDRGLNVLTIDPTFIEIDLGVAQPLEQFKIGYEVVLRADPNGAPEIMTWSYEDPMSVVFDTPTFTPIAAAVPAPPALLTALTGLAGLALISRRRQKAVTGSARPT